MSRYNRILTKFSHLFWDEAVIVVVLIEDWLDCGDLLILANILFLAKTNLRHFL
jgi:hypothetical protein